MIKKFLFTPGPTQVPEEVLLAMSKQIIHHRTPQYIEVLKEVNELLKYVFKTKNEVYTIASSGTGAMETAVVNLLSPGDKVLVLEGGKFSERWMDLCIAYKMNSIIYKFDWGTTPDPVVVTNYLKENPDIKAVFTTLTETSTGTVFDIKELAAITAKTNAVLVVDAISGLCAEDLCMDEWGVDVVITGSQKALMIPPGLSFISVSDKAWKLVEASTHPRFYFSLKKMRKAYAKNDTPFTSAVSLIMALRESLRLIKAEGIDNVIERHRKLSVAIQAGVKATGLTLFSKNPSTVVTAVNVPEGIDGEKFVKVLRDEYGVTFAGGQEPFKGKIIRIATLGYADFKDVPVAIAALEIMLKKSGYKFELGNGVKAALQKLAE